LLTCIGAPEDAKQLHIHAEGRKFEGLDIIDFKKGRRHQQLIFENCIRYLKHILSETSEEMDPLVCEMAFELVGCIPDHKKINTDEFDFII
jgi:hypothetical protein